MSERFRVARLESLEIPSATPSVRWAPIRRDLGVASFGINSWTAAQAGAEVIVEHDELGPGAQRHEELYLVVAGRATFTVDGRTVDAPQGTIVFVHDPGAKRKAVAEEAGTTILTVGARPGAAYEPSAWERSAPALGYFSTQEYDKAYEALARAHAEYPEDGGVLYNLACAESLTGRTDDALSHLEQAIALDERFREYAQSDSDLDAIRDDPRFSRLV